jgi:hypothetical protein
MSKNFLVTCYVLFSIIAFSSALRNTARVNFEYATFANGPAPLASFSPFGTNSLSVITNKQGRNSTRFEIEVDLVGQERAKLDWSSYGAGFVIHFSDHPTLYKFMILVHEPDTETFQLKIEQDKSFGNMQCLNQPYTAVSMKPLSFTCSLQANSFSFGGTVTILTPFSY